jgi:hypothetical protein
MREKSIFNALTRMKFFKHYANYKVGGELYELKIQLDP